LTSTSVAPPTRIAANIAKLPDLLRRFPSEAGIALRRTG
jgi:hypothetical protein